MKLDGEPPTLKSVVVLKTWPSGAEGGEPPAGGGIVTTSGTMAPVLPLYKVAKPVPLSETHQGLVAEDDNPHGLTRLGSVIAATPGISETRLFCRYTVLDKAGSEETPRSPGKARNVFAWLHPSTLFSA